MASQNGHVRQWFRQMRTLDHLRDPEGLFALQSVTDDVRVGMLWRHIAYDAALDGYGGWILRGPNDPGRLGTRIYGLLLFDRLSEAERVVAYDRALAKIRQHMEEDSREIWRKHLRGYSAALMDVVR